MESNWKTKTLAILLGLAVLWLVFINSKQINEFFDIFAENVKLLFTDLRF